MEDEVLQVDARSQLGSANSRRLRKDGKIPAILYGHGEENVCLAVSADQLSTALRHGSQMVHLKGAVDENALIRDIQWDAFGSDVLHLDLTRVRAGEKVEVTVSVELKGLAPGTRDGGQVQQPVHSLRIICPAGSIPESIVVNVNDLQVGGAITLADLVTADDIEFLADASDVLVQCQIVEDLDEEEGGVGGDVSEPEVIGGRKDEEEGDE